MNDREEDGADLSSRWRLLYVGVVLYTLALILALYGLTLFLDYTAQ